MTPTPPFRSVAAGMLLLVLLPVSSPAAAAGQASPEIPDRRPPTTTAAPEWTRDLALTGANALLGAASAAVTAWMRGEPVARAFFGGGVGGGVVFVGKRVAAARFDGAGLLGRQIGAVGSSVVANAGRGAGWLDELWLPLGPVLLGVGGPGRSRLRVSASDVAVLGWAATRSELVMDWSASLSAGAPVLRAPDHRVVAFDRTAAGVALGGVVLLAADADASVLVHELVHVVQHDFVQAVVGRPVEEWGWGLLAGRAPPVEFGIGVVPAWLLLEDLLQAEAWEMEER